MQDMNRDAVGVLLALVSLDRESSAHVRRGATTPSRYHARKAGSARATVAPPHADFVRYLYKCVVRALRFLQRKIYSVRVVVQLKLEEALELQTGRSLTSNLERVVKLVSEEGGVLRAIHPEATNPLLAPYFKADVPDRPAAERLVSRLLANDAVVAAYVEPSISPA
jgi:hypothetical protein